MDKQLAIESTKYVDILDTTCLKNHRFDSLSSNILCKFFNVISKNLSNLEFDGLLTDHKIVETF